MTFSLRNSLAAKLFIVNILFSLLISVFFFQRTYSYFINALTDSQISDMKNASEIVVKAMENSLSEARELGETLMPECLSMARRNSYDEIEQLLESQHYYRQDIRHLYLLDRTGTFVSDTSAVSAPLMQFYSETILQLKESQETFLYRTAYVSYASQPVILYAHRIYDWKTDTNFGYLLMDLDYTTIFQDFTAACGRLIPRAFIAEEDGTILLSRPLSTNYSPLMRNQVIPLGNRPDFSVEAVFGTRHAVYSTKLQNLPWHVVTMMPFSVIESAVSTARRNLLLTFLGLILFDILTSLILVILVNRPLSSFLRTVSLIRSGDLNARVNIYSNDELGRLGMAFNQMTAEMKSLLETSVQQEKNRSELQYEILQAQINPHFLYNTLDSIRWLATINNDEGVSEMVSALIRFLKYTLSNPEGTVTVGDELNNIVQYCIIQRFRFGDSFSVEYDVPQEVRSAPAIRFMLQPIVENSLLHGYDPEIITEQFLIRISGKTERNTVIIDIDDNGVGMDLGLLEDSASKDKNFNGVGLSNIHSRIRLQYGEDYGLFFSGSPLGGLRVSIHLPGAADALSASRMVTADTGGSPQV